jgi:phospholipid-translocating ATPase
MYKSAYQPSK